MRVCDKAAGGRGARTYFGHLRVTEIFVHDHALEEFGVFQPAAHFAFHFDELEVHVPALHVGHGEDGVYGDLGHLPVTAVHPGRGGGGKPKKPSTFAGNDCNRRWTRDTTWSLRYISLN